jgi:hypothetical protein
MGASARSKTQGRGVTLGKKTGLLLLQEYSAVTSQEMISFDPLPVQGVALTLTALLGASEINAQPPSPQPLTRHFTCPSTLTALSRSRVLWG